MEVREEFSALLDDELTLEERERVEGHLAECAECLRELDALKQVDVAYGGLSTVNAPEDFEEGVRQAIRPRTRWFPALGGARPARWLRPAAAMAAVLLAMIGAVFLLGPAGPERFEVANVLENEAPPALMAEEGLFSPTPAAPAGAPPLAVNEEVRAGKPSSVRALDEKGDAEFVDDVRERFVRERLELDAPEAAESDADSLRSESKANPKPKPKKDELAQERLQSLGYVDGAGAGVRKRRVAGRQLAAEAAVPSRGVGEAKESLQVGSKEGVRFDAENEPQSADAEQVVTTSEALQEEYLEERAEILGDPARGEPADVELGKAVDSAREFGFTGESVADDEQSPTGRLEDRVARVLEQSAPVKTVRVRSYEVEADGSWVERGYDGEKTTLLKRGSKDLEALVALEPDIERIVQRPARIVFQVNGKWYVLEAAEEE